MAWRVLGRIPGSEKRGAGVGVIDWSFATREEARAATARCRSRGWPVKLHRDGCPSDMPALVVAVNVLPGNERDIPTHYIATIQDSADVTPDVLAQVWGAMPARFQHLLTSAGICLEAFIGKALADDRRNRKRRTTEVSFDLHPAACAA